MNVTVIPHRKPLNHLLLLTISIMTCLILLINVSFKIIVIQGVLFSASSIVSPLIALLYFLVLRGGDKYEQRQVLHQSFLALYLFSIGVYLLVNLPAIENENNQIAYQIVFEDIPNKFFSSTLAFALSIYLPHVYCFYKKNDWLHLLSMQLLLIIIGWFFFFTIDFWLLFITRSTHDFIPIYLYSLLISVVCFFIFTMSYIILSWCRLGHLVTMCRQFFDAIMKSTTTGRHAIGLYPYLVGFSVTIVLISLACEYRVITLTNGLILTASSILSPLALLASNMIGELYGYKANIKLMLILLLSEWGFDLLLMVAVALPSPDFFNLNPFYSFIMPQRIPAATCALMLAFGTNAFLLEKLKHRFYGRYMSLRFLLANTVANSLLCLVNYTILFAGIYPYDEILSLSLDSWFYKFMIILVGSPVVQSLLFMLKKAPQDAERSS